MYDLVLNLLGQQGLVRIIPGWRRTKLMLKPVPVVQQGAFYSLHAQKRQPTVTQAIENSMPSSSAAKHASEGAWMSFQLGSPEKNLRVRRNCFDVENLLNNSNLCNFENAMQVAFDEGLHLSLSAATKLSENLVLDEKARDLLDLKGCYALQQRLRTRVTLLPEAVQISLEYLAHNPDGSNALPGPYPTTSENLRQPVQLLPGLVLPPPTTITPVLGITGH